VGLRPSDVAPQIMTDPDGKSINAVWPLGLLLGLIILGMIAQAFRNEVNMFNMYERLETQNLALTAKLDEVRTQVVLAITQASQANAAAIEAKLEARQAKEAIDRATDTQRDTNSRLEREIERIRERTGKRESSRLPSPIGAYSNALRGPGIA
jgi:Skp family chaperone for outer membrane proteins